APANVIVGTDPGLCEASNVDLGEAQSGDNCGGVQVTNDAPAIFPLGLTIVNWRAEDAAGNVTSASQEVWVEDREAPTVLTQNITLTIQEGEQVEVLPENIDAGSTDNCGSLTLSLDKTLFTDLDEGENTVLLTVEENAGHSSSATALVTIIVNWNPTCEIAAIANNISVELDRKGFASISPREVDNGSFSDCGRIVGETLSQSDFSCVDVGDNLVVYTITDAEGNQAEAILIVTVIDPEAPTISRTPKSITEAFTDGQIFEIPDYRISYPATDNCFVSEFIQIPEPGTILDAQGTYPIILMARDTYGNESQASFDLILSSSGGKGRGKNKFVRNESLIPVPWNTPEKEIASIGFERDNNGQKEELPVIWDLSTYNGLVPGTYEIHGQVQDEEPVLIRVKVAEKTMPEEILILENELTEILQKDQVLATLETIDPEDDQHEYQVLESKDLEVKGNQLIWIGETQKANYPLEFRVKSIDRVGQVIEKDMILERRIDQADFEMYPNPATDFVQLQVNLTGPSHVSIQVFDLAGKILIKDEGEYERGFNKSLEVKSFAAGTYLVQVQINFQIEMKRLIIKK
ncbi:T9SS type A sorting domain-containing protein, partial [Algoriphagus zhangzhouensis]